MITIDLLRRILLFAQLPEAELETLAARAGVGEGSLSVAFVHQYLAEARGSPRVPASDTARTDARVA